MFDVVAMFHFCFVFLGLALCVFVSMQLSGFTLTWYRESTRHRSRERLIRREIELRCAALERQTMLALTARQAWTGWRKLIVVERVDESPDCRSFFLTFPDGTPLPPFRPGQYITVGLPSADGQPILSRCYSLSDAPDPRYWRITVKRVPGGQISNRLHDECQPGDALLVRAPGGKFVPSLSEDRPLVMVAAGVGITPMVSMIRYCLTWQPRRPLVLYYQLRSGEHAPFLAALRLWQDQHPMLRVVTCFSQPRPGDTPDFKGRLNARLVRDHVEALDGQFFICGPDVFMKSIRHNLILGGIPADAVCIESFGASKPTPAKGNPMVAVDVPGSGEELPQTAQVAFQQSNCVTTWSGDDASLLDVAERSGVSLDSGCREGQCGACAVRLLRGKVRYHSEPASGSLEANEVLACIARPQGNVELDA